MTVPNVRGALTSCGGIGFRHVTKDALSILNNEKIEESGRRDYVIDHWFQSLQQAMRGMVLADQDSLLVGGANGDAFRTFLFLDKRFGRKQLRATDKVLQQLKKGEEVKGKEKEVAVQFFKELLRENEACDWMKDVDEEHGEFRFA